MQYLPLLLTLLGVDSGPPVREVPWVRLDFRLEQSEVPDDAFYAAYDDLVDAYLAEGIQVVGVLGDELVRADIDRNSPEFRLHYVTNARLAVGHFKERVRVYEMMDEPNVVMSEDTFARLLHATYNAVKRDNHPACWQVTLLSGALHSDDGDTGAAYFAETLRIGGEVFDWTPTTLPFDGIGYHLDVAQGAADTLDAVRAKTLENLQAIHALSSLPMWVTALGWNQADRIQAAFETMRDSGFVELAVFPLAALDTVKQLAADNLPELAARVAAVRAGSAAVSVTLENTGSATWTSAGYSLGQGGGCPDSTVENTARWALEFIALPYDVAPGESVTLEVSVAPEAAVFAARMARDGVWFGPTAVVEVTAAPPIDPEPDDTDEDGGCSCKVAGRGGSGAGWFVLVVLAVAYAFSTSARRKL